MLDILGLRKVTHVGISISSNNFIELVYIDKASKSVLKYESAEIKYNSAIREIVDFNEFQEVLESLFQEAGLNPSDCAVSLNLPNIHFGITSAESTTDQAYIIENLQSEIEDLYIFKRNEPVISYSVIPSAFGKSAPNIVYAAMQNKIVLKIIEIFDKLGIEIERIDNYYSSILKALKFCPRFERYLAAGEKTTVLVITQNSFCSMNLNDDYIVAFKEEPLAIKSYSPNEVYNIVSKYATDAIEASNPQSLIIISETEGINAEALKERLHFEGDVEPVNKSAAPGEPLIDINLDSLDDDANMVSYMTLSGIGAAVSSYDEYRLNLNFLPAEIVSNNMIEVGPYEVDWKRFSFIIIAFSFLVALVLGLLCKTFLEYQKNTLVDNNRSSMNKIKDFEDTAGLRESSANKESLFPLLKNTLDQNKSILQTYIAISTEIPDTVYIKNFVANSEGGIALLGESKTSEAVETFVSKLKARHQDLMLAKLSVNAKNDKSVKIPGGFTFLIKTGNIDINMNNTTPEGTPSMMQRTEYGETGGDYGNMLPPPAPVI